MTELKQESHSKTFEVLLSKTHACVVLCLYSLLFCNALRNTFLPFPLLTFFFLPISPFCSPFMTLCGFSNLVPNAGPSAGPNVSLLTPFSIRPRSLNVLSHSRNSAESLVLTSFLGPFDYSGVKIEMRAERKETGPTDHDPRSEKTGVCVCFSLTLKMKWISSKQD